LASIYLLCFTQLVSTSLLLLNFTPIYDIDNYNVTGFAFYYDGSLDYFGWPHCVCGIFAICVLVCLVLIPTIYIQLFPFKFFHKFLDVLHVRKQVLISLGDVFTGSYKNGSDNTSDGRYFAGFYLSLRIIVLTLHFIPFDYNLVNIICQCVLYVLFGGMLITFHPHFRNIHNFNEFVIFVALFAVSTLSFIKMDQDSRIFFAIHISFQLGICSLFFLFLIGYFIYRVIKLMRNCYLHCKSSNAQPIPVNMSIDDDGEELVDNNEFADRIENPDDYDEHHVQDAPYAHYPIIQVNPVIHQPASYGSVN
jgi:hypothetical protein